MALNHTLPIYGETHYIHREGLQAHASAPPLYYLLGAFVDAGMRDRTIPSQVLVLRELSVLIGAITVALLYLLGRMLVPSRREFALAVAAIVGFNPMFTYFSAAINSDDLINLICVAVFLALAWGLRQQKPTRKWLIGLGALLGAGLITKPTIVIELVATPVVLIILAKRARRRFWLTSLTYGSYVGGVMILISFWNYLRNWILYRNFSGLLAGSRPDIYRTHPYRLVGSLWEMIFTSKAGYAPLFQTALKSFWGVFDHMEIAMPPQLYNITGTLFFGGLIGTALWMVASWRSRARPLARQRLLLSLIGGLVIVSTIAGFLHLSYDIDVQPQGRYLFAALAPLALAMVGGWEHLLGFLRLKWLAAPMIVTLILLVNGLALVYSLAPDHHDRFVQNLITSARGKVQEGLIYSKDGRYIPQLVPSAALSARAIYAGAPMVANFAARSEEIKDLGISLDIPAGVHGPLIWRLGLPGTIDNLLEADLQHPLAGPAVYDFNVSSYRFTPWKTYVLTLEAPAVTAAEQPVLTGFSDSLGGSTDKAEPKLQVSYGGILDTQPLQTFYQSLFSDSYSSMRGKLQRFLYPLTLVLLLALAVNALAPLFTAFGRIVVSVPVLIVTLILLSPVPGQRGGLESTFNILPGQAQPFELNTTATTVDQGFLDSADCNMISGWAWNANQPNVPIDVDIYDGAIRLTTIAANVFRSDLLRAGIGNGYHSFTCSLQGLLKTGNQHSISVRFAGTDTNLGNTPKSITCGTVPVSLKLKRFSIDVATLSPSKFSQAMVY